MVLDHSELSFNYTNIDDIGLKNEVVIDLIKREHDYSYCSLCDRCYMKKNFKLHWFDNKHKKYEYYKTNS